MRRGSFLKKAPPDPRKNFSTKIYYKMLLSVFQDMHNCIPVLNRPASQVHYSQSALSSDVIRVRMTVSLYPSDGLNSRWGTQEGGHVARNAQANRCMTLVSPPAPAALQPPRLSARSVSGNSNRRGAWRGTSCAILIACVLRTIHICLPDAGRPNYIMPELRYASSITRCICAASRNDGMHSRPSATADKNA